MFFYLAVNIIEHEKKVNYINSNAVYFAVSIIEPENKGNYINSNAVHFAVNKYRKVKQCKEKRN